MRATPLAALAACAICLCLAAPATAADATEPPSIETAERLLEGEPNQPLQLAAEIDAHKLWHLRNTGKPTGVAGADIDWLGAMSIDKRDPRYDRRVGVIDTGVMRSHPELAGRICELEVPGNGIDDDGNGIVDDAWGWDAANNDTDPRDVHGHGTFVAGLIAAEDSDDGMGAIGAAREACIVPIKVFKDSGQGDLKAMVAGIDYAIRLGLPVVNISAGIKQESKALARVIERAQVKGMAVVAAAGNEGLNADRYGFYPAALPNPNVISVAASDKHDRLADFSNYGRKSVDLAAPGVSVRSTRNTGDVGGYSGTSFSAPLVAATVTEMLRANSRLGPWGLRKKVVNQADRKPAFKGKTASGGRLNMARALRSVGADRSTAKPKIKKAMRLGKAAGSAAQRRKHRFVRLHLRAGERGQRFWLVVDGRVRRAIKPGTTRVRIKIAKAKPGKPHRAVLIAADRAGNETRSKQIRFR